MAKSPKILLSNNYLRMYPILVSPTATKPDPALYPCPVFRTSERAGNDNLAMMIHLPIDGDVNTWIERGVALTIESKIYH